MTRGSRLAIPWIGNAGEEQRLVAAWEGDPCVTVIEGEAGVGTSALIRSALAASRTGGRSVAVAACSPSTLTLAPIVDAARSRDLDPTRVASSPLAGALRPLLPEWLDALPEALPAAPDERASRHRVLRALSDLLRLVGVEVIVVEDAQWADDATMELLLHLTAQRPQRVGVTVAYRPEEEPTSALLPGLVAHAAEAGLGTWIRIDPLDEPGVAQIAAAVLGAPVAWPLAVALHRATAGVRGLVEESVRMLRDRGELERAESGWDLSAGAEVPLPAALIRRTAASIAALPTDAQQLVSSLAALGRPADETIAAAAAGLPRERARIAAARLERARVVQCHATGLASVRIPLVARAVLEAMTEWERRATHLRVARVLEALPGVSSAELLSQFRAAAEPESWLRLAEQTGRDAADRGDHDVAIDVLEDALTHCAPDAKTRGRLVDLLAASALMRSTGGTDVVRRVVAATRAALDDREIDEARRAEIRGKLVRIVIQSAQPLDFQPELEAAIPFLKDNPFATAQAMAAMGYPRADRRPRQLCVNWLRRAGDVPTDRMSPPERLFIAVNITTARGLLGDVDESAVAGLFSGRRPEDVPRDEQLITGAWYLNTGARLALEGRLEAARERLRRAAAFADLVANRRFDCHVLAARGRLDWLAGRWAGLGERLDRLESDADAEPSERLEAAVVRELLAARQQTRPGESKTLADQAAEAHELGSLDLFLLASAGLTSALLRDDEADAAVRASDEAAHVLLGKECWTLASEIAPARMSALTAAGDAAYDASVSFLETLESGLGAVDAPSARASLAHCRAILAERVGDREESAAAWMDAVDRWEETGRRYDALLCRERALSSRLSEGDGVEGLVALHGDFSSLGAIRDAARVAAALREAGVRVSSPARRGRRGYGNEVSPRERDVVRLVAAGWTNRRVADALYRSPKTVSLQLRSAMRKLGATSRLELAVAAAEAGLLEDEPTASDSGRPPQ